MKILISGAGRGGTNLLTELVNKISDVNFTSKVEDRDVFKKQLPDNYGTKLATEHPHFNIGNVDKILTTNDDLKIIFSLRHPLDNCLSKIYRGRPSSKGGDKGTEIVSADGTISSSVQAINKLYGILEHTKEKWSDRILIIKMEDIITDPKGQVDIISEFLNIEPKEYEGFQSKNRNKYQKGRYGNKLDTSQINQYKDLQNSYDGYFKDGKTLNELSDKLVDLIGTYYE